MKLHESLIAGQSHQLLDELGHEAVGIVLEVERKLRSIDVPEISWQMETGVLRGMAGKRRDILVVEHAQFCEYKVLIASRTVGSALHLSWMLTVTPRQTKGLRRALRLGVERENRFRIGDELDLFDMFDLNAFVKVTQLALKHAVRILAAGGDPSDEAVEWAPGLEDQE